MGNNIFEEHQNPGQSGYESKKLEREVELGCGSRDVKCWGDRERVSKANEGWKYEKTLKQDGSFNIGYSDIHTITTGAYPNLCKDFRAY